MVLIGMDSVVEGWFLEWERITLLSSRWGLEKVHIWLLRLFLCGVYYGSLCKGDTISGCIWWLKSHHLLGKNISDLQILGLYGWLQRFKALMKQFHGLSFKHIYRIFNMEVDALLKEAAGDIMGSILFKEFVDGVLIDEGYYRFF